MAPSADVVAAFKAAKSAIVSELRLRQALDRQRREELERRDISRWINSHFNSSAPGQCIHCGGGPRNNDRFVIVFVGSDRADVHASCHQTWLAERQAAARRALGLECDWRLRLPPLQSQQQVPIDASQPRRVELDVIATWPATPFLGEGPINPARARDGGSISVR